jgi:hypothetical protein
MSVADESPTADARERLERFCSGFLADRVVARSIRSDSDPESEPPQKDKYGFALPSTHPYPGLRSFTTREARLFFGRQAEADELRGRLSASNVVVVLGGSGSGKSSLVLAGVLPRLNDVGRIPSRTGRWYAATFRPGDSPCERIIQAIWTDICQPLLSLDGGPLAFTEIMLPSHGPGPAGVETIKSKIFSLLKPEGSLTIAGIVAFLDTLEAVDERLAKLRSSLRSGRINLLLLIDQFEELFRDRLRRDKKEDIERVVDLLEYARNNPKGPLVIIATLRSEELHRCAEFDRLAPIVNQGFYLIDHPKISALTEAAVKPGRQTLLDWDVDLKDDGTTRASKVIAEGEHAPFSIGFLEKLKHWVERFQGDDTPPGVQAGIHHRHQADFLPLFQHMLRISWSAAVDRWHTEQLDHPTVEPADIENWVDNKKNRVAELRSWLTSLGTHFEVPELSAGSHNMLELCFDTGFAIAISEAITGKSWDKLEKWPPTSEAMKQRLRATQLILVALATRDDKGNDARRPAKIEELLQASANLVDRKTIENVISYFKARNYLRGGNDGDPYDVNHEALIRNSSEYQAWLAEAKHVADSLYDAHAALTAGAYESTVKARGEKKWQEWFRKRYSSFMLRPFSDAAERLSDDSCRHLEPIFGADAVFDPDWMAERAELPGTKKERRESVQNLTTAWKNAHRWRVDFAAGQKGRLGPVQWVATRVKRFWTEAKRVSPKPFEGGHDRARQTSKQTAVALSGRELLWAKLGLVFAATPLALIVIAASGYVYNEWSSSRDALEVLSVTSEAGYPRLGLGNEQNQMQIIKSGKRIEQLQRKFFPSERQKQALTVAEAAFGVTARYYLDQFFFEEAAPKPTGRELECIRFDGNDDAIETRYRRTSAGARKFEVMLGENKRLIPKSGEATAEILDRETTQVLVGKSIACGVQELNFLIVWTQLEEVSIPLVYPVHWYRFEDREYAKIGSPIQPRHHRGLSSKIDEVRKKIASSLGSAELSVKGQDDKNSHWVVVTIDMPGAGSFALRFARGIENLMLVDEPKPPAALGECKRVSADDLQEIAECVSPSQQPKTIGINLFSQAFDRNTKSGVATRPCSDDEALCAHKIWVSHSPSVNNPFKIAGAELGYFLAPPIRNAGFWHGYLLLKDKENTYRSLAVENWLLLGILEQRPGPSNFDPATQRICKAFGCEKWPG